MKRDELRRLLRDADPAQGCELPAVERARIRAAIAGASGRAPARGAAWPVLVLASAGAALAFFLYMSPREAGRPAPPQAATPETAVAPPPSAPAGPAPAAVAAVKAPPRRPARVHAAREQDGPPTRIVFTAPEGTRILWFVGTPDAKELGS
jgi:hypothetical protein